MEKPITKTEILDLLSLAVAHLEQGWCQGVIAQRTAGLRTSSNDRHAARHCAVGAVSAAARELAGETWSEGRGLYQDACRLLEQEAGCGLALFNDRPERTKQEVIELFSRTAHTLSSK